jgi:nucleoside-diphosphate-sugar epimerase
MDKSKSQKPTISILGCGWYGMALGTALAEEGYCVKGSTTTSLKLPLIKANGITPYLVNFEIGETAFGSGFFDCDILLISIPPKRNSPTLNDYPIKIASIADAAKHVKHVIFISSSGVFEDGNFIVDETDKPNPQSDSGKVMLAAEKILQNKPSFSTTIIRFAGLIGPERTLTKHFAGKKEIANGLAPINLILLSDCIGLTIAIIKLNAFDAIYHGVTPHHPTRADFYTKTCLAHGLEKPAFINELLIWKKIESINVPAKLNYSYKVKDWDEWLESGIA